MVRRDGALRVAAEFLGDASVTVMDHNANQGRTPQYLRTPPLSLTASGDVGAEAVVQRALPTPPDWSTNVQLTSTTLPATRVSRTVSMLPQKCGGERP